MMRAELKLALERLCRGDLPVKATYKKSGRRWQLSGIGRRVEVAVDSDALEMHRGAMPLDASLAEEVAKALLPVGNLPLVVREFACGPYACREARWVFPDGRLEQVGSLEQLLELCRGWGGSVPPAAAILAAEEEAQEAARRRAEQMKEAARASEEASLRCQLEGARIRLKRELGRTLRCMGRGDPQQELRRLLAAPGAPERYRRAVQRLGDFPRWEQDELAEIEQYVNRLNENQRIERIQLGKELEAALNDPRWLAREGLRRLAEEQDGFSSRVKAASHAAAGA